MRWPVIVACAVMVGACASIAGLDPVDDGNVVGGAATPDASDAKASSSGNDGDGSQPASSSASSSSGASSSSSSGQPPANPPTCDSNDQCNGEEGECGHGGTCVDGCFPKNIPCFIDQNCCFGLTCEESGSGFRSCREE